MTTIEEVYESLGVVQPFSYSSGDLTTEGLQAREKLEQILTCLERLGVLPGWSQDRLDELEGFE